MPNHPNIDIIVRLAREDLAILHARKKIREAIEAQKKTKQDLKDAEDHLSKMRSALATLKGEEQRLQQEIETYERRRSTAHRVLETGNGDPDAAERQLKQCADIIGELESELLMNLDSHEQTDGDIVHHTVALTTLGQSTVDTLSTLTETIAQCEQTIHEKKTSRTHIASQLESFLLKRYEQLRQSKGTAVARVVDECCRSCRLAIPMQDQSDLRRGREIACKKCGRWLFLAE